MEPRTKLKIDVSPHQIDHNSRVCTIGSCFAANMSKVMSEDKFHVDHSPFGTLYNPISISKLLISSLNEELLDCELNVIRDERYVNYLYHSDLNGLDKTELIKLHEIQNKKLGGLLKQADWLIITLGTAHIFRHIAHNVLVANCHKQDDSLFERELLSVESIVNEMDTCIELLLQHNPNLRIILSVSPVRHIKDGLKKNSLSKARLIVACHELSEKYEFVDYFPAYEIIVDELRDYRFYNRDLIHPSEAAIDYIYDLFGTKYFDETTLRLNKVVRSIHLSLNHKPFNPSSSVYQTFQKKLWEKITLVAENHGLNYQEELKALKKMKSQYPKP